MSKDDPFKIYPAEQKPTTFVKGGGKTHLNKTLSKWLAEGNKIEDHPDVHNDEEKPKPPPTLNPLPDNFETLVNPEVVYKKVEIHEKGKATKTVEIETKPQETSKDYQRRLPHSYAEVHSQSFDDLCTAHELVARIDLNAAKLYTNIVKYVPTKKEEENFLLVWFSDGRLRFAVKQEDEANNYSSLIAEDSQ